MSPKPKKDKKRVQNANMEVYSRRFREMVSHSSQKPTSSPGKEFGRNEQESRAYVADHPYLTIMAGRVQ
jgi:hypothetical protein